MALFVLSFVFNLLVGLRLLPALEGPAWWGQLALLLVLFVVMPVGLLARRLWPPRVADRITWVGMLALGYFSSLLAFTLLRDAALIGGWVIGHFHGAGPAWFDDARFARQSAQAVPWLAALVSLVGLFNARRLPRVRRVVVPLAGLPGALDGFRIVQLSDVHVGPTIKSAWVRALVDRVNGLQPDVVAITGDLVDGSVADLAVHVAPLADLRARDGTFFVTGNHEYYSGAHGWIDELRRIGLHVLMNEHVILERGGMLLVLAGVTDFGAGHFDAEHRSDPAAAARGAPADAVKVLLAHQPRSAPAAAEAGFDLQLSGHTHGGQFLPWRWFVPLQQPYVAGLHQLGRLWVYVSQGTGYWGPPKRVGAPAEITEIRLVPAT